jgi:hypothetical protein
MGASFDRPVIGCFGHRVVARRGTVAQCTASGSEPSEVQSQRPSGSLIMERARIFQHVAAVAACAAIGLYSNGSSAGNMILTVDGISTPIEVLSFKMGASNPVTIGGGGSGTGKVVYSDFLFTAPESAATPLQLLSINRGQHFPTARLQVLSPNGVAPISEWTFEQAQFASITVESGAADPKSRLPNTFLPPQTSFGMVFGKFCYRVFGTNGSVSRETCWDIARNVAS